MLDVIEDTEILKMQVHNLSLNLKKKDHELRRLKESHKINISNLKAHYAKQLLTLRIKKRDTWSI